MIILPAANIFRQAFGISWESLRSPSQLVEDVKAGVPRYFQVFRMPEQDSSTMARPERRKYQSARAQAEKTRSAIGMTLGIAAIVVPLNLLFGLAAAWAVTKFRFRGRTLFVSLIDLPFAVSPVVAGLIFVLLMGRVGFCGDWATKISWPVPTSLEWQGFAQSWIPLGFSNWQRGIIFTPFAIALASIFVTFPFIARALIPLMQNQGTEQEQAALTLGAGGWRMFFKVTLPQIKWALLYGTILCLARCVGEFGAVSVVSGSTDPNDTMPLRIEKLWQEYNTQAAFSVASLLAVVSVMTLLLKIVIEKRAAAQFSDKKQEAQ
ncbi:MAG: sulfate ABC transporter permease [Burkholderiales bacterium]|nr:sulfate ABC transporter permease [Phycisphaerae bacterium]